MADQRSSVSFADLRFWVLFGVLLLIALLLYFWFAPATPPVMVPGAPEGAA